MSNPWRAQRLLDLPPYLFVEIDRRKRAAREAGVDVIDLGVGDPDAPTPHFIVEAMARAIREPENHKYAIGGGKPEFREAAAEFMQRRFGVHLDARTEVLALLGSKEGIGHLPLAVLNPGEVALIPQPAYPVYQASTILAGGVCHIMPLSAEHGWLPQLDQIPADVCRRARLMFINYPNNPTSACASLGFFQDVVAFARQHDLLVMQDAAYSELYFGETPPSLLQVDGAKDVGIEIHSLSKTFNMTGWRIGFAVGNADVLAALAQVKSNLDSGIFGAVQRAGIEALHNTDHVEIRAQTDVYKQRRDLVVEGLRAAGWSVTPPEATFYIWAGTPGGRNSMEVCSRVLEETGVVLIPGGGFGPCGEGYARLALTVDQDRMREALDRIARIQW